MNRATAAVGVAAVALWATTVSAQGRNFSGNWTIDSERTIAANGAAGGAMRSGGGGGGRGGGGAAGGGAVVGGVAAAGGGGGAVMRTAGDAGAGGGGGARGGRGAAGPTMIALDTTTFTVGTTAYKLDGTPTTRETPAGNITAKAAWKGDKLTIETTSPTPNGNIVTTQTWYLEGDALVRETSIPAQDGGEARVNKTYYKRA